MGHCSTETQSNYRKRKEIKNIASDKYVMYFQYWKREKTEPLTEKNAQIRRVLDTISFSKSVLNINGSVKSVFWCLIQTKRNFIL